MTDIVVVHHHEVLCRCWVDVYGGSETTTTTTSQAPPVTGTTATPDACSCGVANSAMRIVGGVETEAHEYPWQVALLVSDRGSHPWCGGTLISPRHVLTAAHCTEGYTTANLTVLLGEHRVDDNVFNKKTLSAILDHPDYNVSVKHDNDFSILTLSEPVAFTRDVSPACLPADPGQDFVGQVATVSGWGLLSWSWWGGNYPTTLMEVDVTVMTNAECISAYEQIQLVINSNMICAADSGKDSCSGDSGGPMVVQENGRYTLAGVVSWGRGCAHPEYPGVYARVTAQKDWILANTEGTQDSSLC